MYAIVETGGKQFKVAEGDKIRVPRIKDVEKDSTVDINKVLLITDDESTEVGKPLIEGASVQCKVITEARTPKIIVFKFKRRKDYRRKLGSREYYTKLLVEKINKA